MLINIQNMMDYHNLVYIMMLLTILYIIYIHTFSSTQNGLGSEYINYKNATINTLK